MPEALETWKVSLIEFLLPRHAQIINEINFRFLNEARNSGKLNDHEIMQVSVFHEGPDKLLRMANLAVIGSHSVNGVATSL